MKKLSKADNWILLNEEADPEFGLHPNKRMRILRQKHARYDARMRKMLAEELHKEENEFQMTYKAARHEQAWLSDALSPFFHDSLISDVMHMVRGGKEANVYCCRATPLGSSNSSPQSRIADSGQETEMPGLLAVKIYRPQNRVMKDDSVYREGRMYLGDDGKVLLKHREARAIQKKTRKGKKFTTASWVEYDLIFAQIDAISIF